MLLNNFFVNVIIRITFIVLSAVIFGIVLQHLNHGFYYTLTGIVILILLQALMLINQVNKINSDLEKFFSSVQDHERSVRFIENPYSKSFRKLHARMNYVNKVIQDAKTENERTRLFLQSVVDHVDIGLLSFDKNGEIEICNRAAKRYLNVQQIIQLSSLKNRNDELSKTLFELNPGQESLVKMKKDNLFHSVLLKASELKFEEHPMKLISFEDITSELDKKELDSWQRLIRVLTHEIMNSISPITSLSSVISGYFKKKDSDDPVQPEGINNQIILKTLSGLNTIEETGRGLLDFVDKYRSLTLLPKPKLTIIPVDNLIRKCMQLMESDIPERIKITSDVNPADISIMADFSQVEQIIINLIKNSVEALENNENGVIHLKAYKGDGGILIQVEDNGAGISNDIIEDIFVPFYTTKKNGSGIGLSLSKQIMQNHNGTISVISVPERGTKFTLRFPSLG